MKRQILAAWVAGCGAMTLSGCNGSTASQLVREIQAELADGRVDLAVEFTGDLSLNLEVLSRIGDYGTVQFVPSGNETGFTILLDLSVESYADPGLVDNIVRSLPNGTPFPSYVDTAISAFEFARDKDWSGLIYLGLEPGKRLLGTSVNLEFLNGSFPPGVNITQRIRGRNNTILGSVTFFGPAVDSSGSVTAPGGIFVAVGLNAILSQTGQVNSLQGGHATIPVTVDPEMEVYNPQGADLSDAELARLYQLVIDQGRAAGVID